MPSTSSLVTSFVLRRADDLAVLHHSDAIGEVEHVVDIVADQEDADAVGLQLLDQLADLRRLLRPERGRRLVHDEDARIEMDRARDRHRLPLAARKRFDGVLEAAEIRIEPPHHLARLRTPSPTSSSVPQRVQNLAAEIEIRRRVDVVRERERLIDRLDAVVLGVARIVDRALPRR